jgi:methylated-DNA-protein-cysteine methyltransferase related protein
MDRHYFEAVYDVVRAIPPGRVTNYGAIADFLGLGSARMVGWALRQSIASDEDIPAHRVVNRSGVLSGRLHFPGPEEMAARLRAEGIEVAEDRVTDFQRLFWHPRTLAEDEPVRTG